MTLGDPDAVELHGFRVAVAVESDGATPSPETVACIEVAVDAVRAAGALVARRHVIAGAGTSS